MEDTTICPICGNDLKTEHYPSLKVIRRICSGMNHFLSFYIKKAGEPVALIRFSIDPKYSKQLEIDYQRNNCTIFCSKMNKPETIEINKILEPDFPNLTKLKEQIDLYILFS